MSLWGRTVITSLASALPVVGTSIVGWQWGGFCVKFAPIIFIFCENFAICGNNSITLCYINKIGYSTFNNNVKKQNMSQSAGLKTITNGSWAFAQNCSNEAGSCDKVTELLLATGSNPQRLDARQGAWLVGIVEADGWFITNKNGIYVQYEMGLELHKRKIEIQKSLKKLFNTSRNVRIRKDRPNIVTFKIRAKSDLINTIVPIFDRFPMVGAKKQRYRFFRYNLIEKNTIYSRDLDTSQRSLYKKDLSLLTETTRRTIKNRLSHPLFDCWLVGFINAEGSFSVYKATAQKNQVIFFPLAKQLMVIFCALYCNIASLFFLLVFILIQKQATIRLKQLLIMVLKKFIIFLIVRTRSIISIYMDIKKSSLIIGLLQLELMNAITSHLAINTYFYFFNKSTPPLFIAQGCCYCVLQRNTQQQQLWAIPQAWAKPSADQRSGLLRWSSAALLGQAFMLCTLMIQSDLFRDKKNNKNEITPL